MHAIFPRSESVKRWWEARATFAAAGFTLLLVATWAARETDLIVHRALPHQASPLEFFVALLAVVCGSSGLACLLVGPGLFREVPHPPRDLS